MLGDRLSDLVYRLRALFRRKAVETELDEELRFHFEQQVAKNVAAGMSRGEARRQARLAFGGLDQVKEECREARGVGFVETVMQDLRYAIRQLAKSPGFTAVAVLSLALGIGANTAIFSLVDAVLLRMLPVERPEELEQVRLTNENSTSTFFSYPVFRELRELELLSEVIARKTTAAGILAGDRPQRGIVEVVSGNYFSALGVRPFLGRLLNEDDDRAPMQHPVAVLSFRFWRERMSADPEVTGQTIRLKNDPYTVVGVAQPGFFGVEVGTSPDVWIPTMQGEAFAGAFDAGKSVFDSRNVSWLNIIARRAPGVSRNQAQEALNVSFRRFAERESGARPSWMMRYRIDLHPGGQGFSRLQGKFENPLFVLMVLVTLVLAIACANVANLLLARYAARSREIGVRLALGAGRVRLIRQLLTECTLLGLLGGVLGVLFAGWGVQLLLAFLPSDYFPLALHVPIDTRFVSFAAAVSFLTILLFGLVPSIQSTRASLSGALKEERAFDRGARFDLRKSLVALQVALSLLLLLGGGLFLRSLRNTAALDLGLNTENVLMASIDPPHSGYSEAQTIAFFRNLETRLRALPGVRAVGLTFDTLLRGGFYQAGNEYSSPPDPEQPVWVETNGDFFAAVGIRIVRGRSFGPQDTATSQKVAIINETAARYHFSEEDPIGKIAPGIKDNRVIVGIAGDAKLSDVHEATRSVLYLVKEQRGGPSYSQTVYLRVDHDAGAYAPILRGEVAALDDRLPLYNVKTFAAQKDEAMARERLVATLSGFFAALSLLLAAIGIYGVVAYGVVARTREIGVRMSLGAQRGDVVRMVLRNALGLVAAGLAIGLPLALCSSRFVESLLFGVEPNDPLTLVVTVVILLAAALLAASIPARRASRVDPLTALRHE